MDKTKIHSVNDRDSFQKMIENVALEVRDIAEELRMLIFNLLPDVTEVVWEKQCIAGYGIGSKKMSEQFCYIAPFKKHVNFGFYYGADLDDPSKLLDGTGKSLRHIKIRSKGDIAKPEVKKLLKQASKHLPNLKNTSS